MPSVERGRPICPIAALNLLGLTLLQPLLVLNKLRSLKLSPFATSDIIGHVTTRFVICDFLYVINLNQPSTVHDCQDMVFQRFWGHESRC